MEDFEATFRSNHQCQNQFFFSRIIMYVSVLYVPILIKYVLFVLFRPTVTMQSEENEEGKVYYYVI